MNFHIVTIFPDMIKPFLEEGVLGRAKNLKKKIDIKYHNPRNFTDDLPAPLDGYYFVYILLCEDDSMYIGHTSDLRKRWEQHARGNGAIHTAKNKPKRIIHWEIYNSRKKASNREKELKTGFGRKWLKREFKANRLLTQSKKTWVEKQAGKHRAAYLQALASMRRQVDERPFGGGPGMVMKAEPLLKVIDSILEKDVGKIHFVILSPRGGKFDAEKARELSTEFETIVLISGRYEGIDERVHGALDDLSQNSDEVTVEEMSIGDYVLSGGELAAGVIVDAVSRHVEGVLGNKESIEEERIASREVYTRPDKIKWRGREYDVPEILLSGHHKRIEEWKKKR